MKNNAFIIFLSVFFVIICQLTNYFIKVNYPDFVFKNQGIIFGFLHNKILIYLVVICGLVLLFYLIKIYQKEFLQHALAISLVFAGAISNLLDRLLFGYVVDYINTGLWPVFNLADIFIALGLVMLVISMFIKSS